MRQSLLRGAAATILALIVFSSSAIASSGWTGVRLGLLAVSSEGMHGMVIYANVSVGPGDGTLVVEPAKLVDESTVFSTKVAFVLASLLAHRNPSGVSARVLFHTSTMVGGPSASGFLAATMYLLEQGIVPYADNYTMTGMVSPTGLLLSVAGVREKLDAAAAAGYRYAVIPALEATKKLVKSLNKSITVIPACNVLEAASVLSSGPRKLPTLEAPMLKTPQVFAKDTTKFISYAKRLLPSLPEKTRDLVERLLEAANQTLPRDPYSAASLAFTALLTAVNTTIKLRGLKSAEKALGMTLQEAIAEARKAIEKRRAAYLTGGYCDSWKLFALSAASYRLYLAEHVEGIGDYALALLRALSAYTWARAADELHGPLVPCSSIEGLASFMASYASLSYHYLASVINSPVVRIYVAMLDNRTMSDWLRDINKAIAEHNYPLAIGLSVYIVSEVDRRLSFFNTLPSCAATYWGELAARTGRLSLFPSFLYHRYATEYAGLVAKITHTSPGLMELSLESSALAWLLPGLYLESWLPSASTTEQPTATGIGLWAYAVIAAEAAGLATIAVASARLVREEV